MRIRGYSEETESYSEDVEELSGKIADLTKTASTPGGISLFTDASKTTYKSTYQLLKDISVIYDQLTDKQQAGLLEALAGKRQGQIIAATINNFNAAEKAMETMKNSAGSAEAEMETIRDSAAFAMNELKTTFEELAQSTVTRDFLKGLIKTGTTLLEIVTGVVEHVGALPALLGTIFGIVATKTRTLFSVNNTTGKFTFFGSEIGEGWLDSLKANRAEIAATRELANELITSFDGVTISEEMMTKVSASTSVQLKGLVNDFNAGKISAEEFRTGITNVQASMQNMQTGMAALKIGLKSLAATIGSITVSMLVLTIISKVISLVTDKIDKLVNKEKYVKEAADEAKNAIKDLKNELDNLKTSTKDVGSQFIKLSQGVKDLGKATQSRGRLSTSDYEKFLDLSNQLAELYPTLTKDYDENGNAILNLSGDVNTITASLQRLLEVQQRIANQEIIEKLPDVWKGHMQDLKNYSSQSDYSDAVGEMYRKILEDIPIDDKVFKIMDADLHEKLIEAAQKIGLDDGKWFNNSLKKLYEESYVNYDNGRGGFDGVNWDLSSLSTEQIEKLKNELAKSASEYQDAVNITKDKIKAANAEMSSYINAWLSNEWNFVNLDEPMQNALREILLSGDWIEDLPDEINKNNWDEVSNWLSQNLLYAVRNVNSKDTKQALADAVAGTLSVDGFEKLISNLKNVEGFDDKNPLIIYLQTKLDAKYDLIEGVKARLKAEYRDKVVELSDEDLQIAANLKIPHDTLLSWDELNKKIQEYKKGKPIIKTFEETLEDLKDTIDELVEKQEALAESFKKIQLGATLTSEEVYKLIQQMPELAYWIKRVNDGYTIDPEGFAEMSEANYNDFREKIKKQQEDTQAAITLLEKMRDVASERGYNNPEYMDLVKQAKEMDLFKNLDADSIVDLETINDRLKELHNGFNLLDNLVLDSFDKQKVLLAGIDEQYKNIRSDIDDYNKKIKTVDEAIKTMNEDGLLSYEELNELLDIDSNLVYEKIGDQYKVTIESLEELRKESYETRKSYIEDVKARIEADKAAAEQKREEINQQIEMIKNLGIDGGVDPQLAEFGQEYNDLTEQVNAYTEALQKLDGLNQELTVTESKEDKKDVSKELQDQIDYYKTILDAVKIVHEKYNDAFEDEKNGYEEIKDKMKEANDERQREIDLREAITNLENAKKRRVWVYSEGKGFQQVQDKGAVKEAEEKVRDAVTDVQEAELDKKIKEIEDKQKQLEESTKDLENLEQNINDSKTVEQAKTALGLADEKDLLNLSDAVKKGITEGLTDAIIKKEVEGNKDDEGNLNQYYTPVSLDDVLKSLGANVTAEDVKKSTFDLPTLAGYNAAKAAADEFKKQADDLVKSASTYNNSNVFSPNVTVNGGVTEQSIADTVVKEMEKIFTQYCNTIK